MRVCAQRIIAMGLCAGFVVGALTGCNGASNTDGNASGSVSGSAANGVSTAAKKTFDDLDGMDIKVADWYTDKNTLADRTDEFGKAQNDYWQNIQKQYNFTITRDAFYSYEDAKSDYVNDVMASSPKYDLYYLYQEFVSEPLMKGLMYDLSTLPEFDFSEEKWNPTVRDLMSIGDGIWGMSPDNEPRGGIFYNKRMFKEAGIPEEEPYDLQQKNEWTWDKFEEYCKKLTKDIDGDGTIDQYAMASFSKYYLPMCAASNNATFVTRGEDGKYKSAINTSEFRDAMNWGVDLIEKGYIKPKPSDDVAWDWFKAAFRDGEAAMQTAEVYEITAFANMDDDWGFVMFPYNGENKGATNKTTPNDNIVVMPSCFDAEKAEKIAFAYDQYTELIGEFTPEEQILEQYYPQFKDDRAVSETIAMMLDEKHKQISCLPMISEINYGDFCYPVYARATTPAKKIEELSTKWDKKIEKVNANYEKFAKEHTK